MSKKRRVRRVGTSRIPRPRLHAAPADAANLRTSYVCRIQRHSGAAEGKNKVGVSRPRYMRACIRQREIRGHKPAYYASPRVTNTPNNSRGSVRRSGRYICVRVCMYIHIYALRYRIKL